MNKKNVRNPSKIIDLAGDDEPAVSQRMLHSIQQKLEKSAALNGGFDKLLYKIDSIENSQNAIADKVDKIHEAIYNPDEGLFARINTNKAAQTESLLSVEKKVAELDSWKDQCKTTSEEVEKTTDQYAVKFEKLQNSIEHLNEFKIATVGVTKWFLAAAGGGIATIIFKVLYDLVILK